MTTPTPMTAERLAALLNSSMVEYVKSRTTEDWIALSEAHPAALVREMGVKILLQERDLAAAQEWREAVLNELIVAHIYTKEHETNPRKAIQDAITWNCQVALDPAVSSDAAKLIDGAMNSADETKLLELAAAQEARDEWIDTAMAALDRAQRAEALAESYRKDAERFRSLIKWDRQSFAATDTVWIEPGRWIDAARKP